MSPKWKLITVEHYRAKWCKKLPKFFYWRICVVFSRSTGRAQLRVVHHWDWKPNRCVSGVDQWLPWLLSSCKDSTYSSVVFLHWTTVREISVVGGQWNTISMSWNWSAMAVLSWQLSSLCERRVNVHSALSNCRHIVPRSWE